MEIREITLLVLGLLGGLNDAAGYAYRIAQTAAVYVTLYHLGLPPSHASDCRHAAPSHPLVKQTLRSVGQSSGHTSAVITDQWTINTLPIDWLWSV